MRMNETPDKALHDAFGRSFPYLRLSITDICNFRCSYCLPDGYKCSGASFLSHAEIARLVSAFTDLGVHKIRITGGEPTVRKDFSDIARLVASQPGISQLAFTTNGYRLRDHAKEWRSAGLTHINVSVDSLNPERFFSMTGHDRLSEVLEGVDAALDAGFKKVKINIVLHKGLNDHELEDFLVWAKKAPISIRFIELMQTGDNLGYFQKYHQPTDTLKKSLQDKGWCEIPKAIEAGPAIEYSHDDYKGSIGLIAPYSKDFCAGCNRLRVTSTGDLRLCLFGELGISLRHLLQENSQQEELKALISSQLAFKQSSHFLAHGETGITPHLASVGG